VYLYNRKKRTIKHITLCIRFIRYSCIQSKCKSNQAIFITGAEQPFLLLIKKTSIKSSYFFFHGSRITVLTFTTRGICIKIEKTLIESSYFLHQSKYIKSSYFFSREPCNRFKLYRTKAGKQRNRIKLFFHGSLITGLLQTYSREH
jgi:hypothetical protein